MTKQLLKYTFNVTFATLAVATLSMDNELAGYLFWGVYFVSLIICSLAFLMVTGLRAKGTTIPNCTTGRLERLFNNAFDYALSFYLVISGYWFAGFVWVVIAEVIKHTMDKKGLVAPQEQV